MPTHATMMHAPSTRAGAVHQHQGLSDDEPHRDDPQKIKVDSDRIKA
jgi:hypothetical protein